MADDQKERRDDNQQSGPQPDPGTLHTPDPQKNMEGPVSSSMHGIGKAFETDETPQEADEEKERKM